MITVEMGCASTSPRKNWGSRMSRFSRRERKPVPSPGPSRPGLDSTAAGHVGHPGTDPSQSLGDVLRRQTAGQDQPGKRDRRQEWRQRPACRSANQSVNLASISTASGMRRARRPEPDIAHRTDVGCAAETKGLDDPEVVQARRYSGGSLPWSCTAESPTAAATSEPRWRDGQRTDRPPELAKAEPPRSRLREQESRIAASGHEN